VKEEAGKEKLLSQKMVWLPIFR